MSQTKYPTTNTLMHHQHQHLRNGNGSSQGSFNQSETVMEDELQVFRLITIARNAEINFQIMVESSLKGDLQGPEACSR
jgi:hypothetical protein